MLALVAAGCLSQGVVCCVLLIVDVCCLLFMAVDRLLSVVAFVICCSLVFVS